MASKGALNTACPALQGMGDTMNALITLVNELKTKHNAAMTKLDADAGVTDTNYNSLQGATSASVTALSV